MKKLKIKNIAGKLEWTIILIIHLALLKWILYVLGNAGSMEMTEITLHFTGMALYGALLIRFCAWIAMKRYKKSLKQ